MDKIFIDENGEYGLDYSAAVWASNQMHQIYHDAKMPLSDADFVLEDVDAIMIVEYKNADTKMAKEFRDTTAPFNPMDNKKFASVVRKFYDSYHYLYLLGKDKPVQYIYVIEAPNGDSTMRTRLRDRLKTHLPFALQKNLNTGIRMIDKVDVVSIAEWNESSTYGKYPFSKLQGQTGK